MPDSFDSIVALYFSTNVQVCLVQVIFLSHNNLRSLDGIQQFAASLTKLSAADNSLQDLVSLDELQCCQRLVVLNLEGNTITRLPFYRCADFQTSVSCMLICANNHAQVLSIPRLQDDSLLISLLCSAGRTSCSCVRPCKAWTANVSQLPSGKMQRAAQRRCRAPWR